jgi:hypothetical protein
VSVRALDSCKPLLSVLSSVSWPGAVAGARALVRYVSHHTGLPALVVAALLIAIGYRILKRTARFAVEVAAVALALVAASELGWIRW